MGEEKIDPIEHGLWTVECECENLIKLHACAALMDLLAEIIKRHRLDSFVRAAE